MLVQRNQNLQSSNYSLGTSLLVVGWSHNYAKRLTNCELYLEISLKFLHSHMICVFEIHCAVFGSKDLFLELLKVLDLCLFFIQLFIPIIFCSSYMNYFSHPIQLKTDFVLL